MTALKIEKNVPIPKSHQGRNRTPGYPFAAMQVGDSFFVRCKDKAELNRVRSAAAIHANKTGSKFKTRTVDGGIRVWLVSLPSQVQGQPVARAA